MGRRREAEAQVKHWTTHELSYLEEHAGEGAEAIAEALGFTPRAVEVQASKYGISLRKFWLCPNCGMKTRKPLSPKTGWCASCTKELRNEGIAEEVRALEEEVRREEKVNRERQRLYSAKSRARKKLRKREK